MTESMVSALHCHHTGPCTYGYQSMPCWRHRRAERIAHRLLVRSFRRWRASSSMARALMVLGPLERARLCLELREVRIGVRPKYRYASPIRGARHAWSV